MTNPCTFPAVFEHGPVVIRGLRSISPAQAEIVAQRVAAAAASWRVESHDDYDGHLSIIVSSDQEDAPTFAMTGRADQIELCEIRDDVLHDRGSFGSVEGAAALVLDLVLGASL